MKVRCQVSGHAVITQIVQSRCVLRAQLWWSMCYGVHKDHLLGCYSCGVSQVVSLIESVAFRGRHSQCLVKRPLIIRAAARGGVVACRSSTFGHAVGSLRSSGSRTTSRRVRLSRSAAQSPVRHAETGPTYSTTRSRLNVKLDAS